MSLLSPLDIDLSPDALRVSGEIDLTVAPHFLNAILCFGTASDRPTAVVVDLTSVTFIDCTGLLALVEADKALGGVGRDLVVANPSRAVTRAMRLTGIDEHLQVTVGGADRSREASTPADASKLRMLRL